MARELTDEEANELVKKSRQKGGVLDAVRDIPAYNWIAVIAGCVWGIGIFCFIHQPVIFGGLMIAGFLAFALGVWMIIKESPVKQEDDI